jgi:hypothetical protein
MRIPADSQWLHLREQFGELSLTWNDIICTAAERRAEELADESGADCRRLAGQVATWPRLAGVFHVGHTG